MNIKPKNVIKEVILLLLTILKIASMIIVKITDLLWKLFDKLEKFIEKIIVDLRNINTK